MKYQYFIEKTTFILNSAGEITIICGILQTGAILF